MAFRAAATKGDWFGLYEPSSPTRALRDPWLVLVALLALACGSPGRPQDMGAAGDYGSLSGGSSTQPSDGAESAGVESAGAESTAATGGDPEAGGTAGGESRGGTGGVSGNAGSSGSTNGGGSAGTGTSVGAIGDPCSTIQACASGACRTARDEVLKRSA